MQAHPSCLLFFFLATPRWPELGRRAELYKLNFTFLPETNRPGKVLFEVKNKTKRKKTVLLEVSWYLYLLLALPSPPCTKRVSIQCWSWWWEECWLPVKSPCFVARLRLPCYRVGGQRERVRWFPCGGCRWTEEWGEREPSEPVVPTPAPRGSEPATNISSLAEQEVEVVQGDRPDTCRDTFTPS